MQPCLIGAIPAEGGGRARRAFRCRGWLPGTDLVKDSQRTWLQGESDGGACGSASKIPVLF